MRLCVCLLARYGRQRAADGGGGGQRRGRGERWEKRVVAVVMKNQSINSPVLNKEKKK